MNVNTQEPNRYAEASVRGQASEVRAQARALMPDNYTVSYCEPATRTHSTLRIMGKDHAGWTLEHVIRRLETGLIFAEEVTPNT